MRKALEIVVEERYQLVGKRTDICWQCLIPRHSGVDLRFVVCLTHGRIIPKPRCAVTDSSLVSCLCDAWR
jgi:hypothetical protein